MSCSGCSVLHGVNPNLKEKRQTECFAILGHFLPFYPTNNLKNYHFKKMKKSARDISLLHICTINEDHMMYGSWDIRSDRIFFNFHNNPENQNFDKMKIKFEDIIILHGCHKWFWINIYGSWDIDCKRQFFCHFRPLRPLPINPENQYFEQMKMTPGDTFIPSMTIIWCMQG